VEGFLKALAALPGGYSRGVFEGAPWGVSVERSPGGKRVKLYGEALGASDHVSFNLYHVGGDARLKPCEMPVQKVMAFVIGYQPDMA